MTGRYELHHGFVFALAGGTFQHDQLAFALRTVFGDLFRPPCRTFGADFKIRVAEASYYYCDAGVLCDDVDPRAVFCTSPRVVAEVLSPSTRAYDLVEKRAAYRALPSLRAYVVVHTAMRRIEVDERGPDGRWQTQTYDDGDACIGARSFALDAVYGPAVAAGSDGP